MSSIYYLPGRSGRVAEGLGAFLQGQCDQLSGREVAGDLKRLVFADQLAAIRQDLLDSHWHDDGRLVANSYGAYLLLHTLIDMEQYPGNIVLLSPILGAVQTQKLFFRPPGAKRLLQSFEAGTFPKPRILRCIVGEFDWQSESSRCVDLCDAVNGRLSVVLGGSHNLNPEIVRNFFVTTEY